MHFQSRSREVRLREKAGEKPSSEVCSGSMVLFDRRQAPHLSAGTSASVAWAKETLHVAMGEKAGKEDRRGWKPFLLLPCSVRWALLSLGKVKWF